MNLEGYRLPFEDVRESDIDSLVSMMDENAEEKAHIYEEGYVPRSEVEEILKTSHQMEWYENPVRYDMEQGTFYSAVSDSEIVVIGDEDTLVTEMPELQYFGEPVDLDLSI